MRHQQQLLPTLQVRVKTRKIPWSVVFVIKERNFNLEIFHRGMATKVGRKTEEKHITEERKGMEM